MSLYEDASKLVNSGSNTFVSIPVGKKIRLRILDHPYVSTKQWNEGGEIKTRFHWPVWDYESGKAKVLEQGAMVFNALTDIITEYGEDMPMACDISIGKTGDGLNTRYSVVPGKVQSELPSGFLMPDMKTIVKGGVSLEDFTKGKKPTTQSRGSDDEYEPEEVPIEAYE